jgi:hypothetical protein
VFGLEPTFTAILNDAALTVRLAKMDEPVIDVDGINMTIRVEKAEEGRVLTLDPVVIFDHRKLSPRLASNLLHLFDPTIGDIPEVDGEFSLALDKLRVPIGVPREEQVKRIEMEGKLVLHQVSTDAKTPMRQALVQLVADTCSSGISRTAPSSHRRRSAFGHNSDRRRESSWRASLQVWLHLGGSIPPMAGTLPNKLRNPAPDYEAFALTPAQATSSTIAVAPTGQNADETKPAAINAEMLASRKRA